MSPLRRAFIAAPFLPTAGARTTLILEGVADFPRFHARSFNTIAMRDSTAMSIILSRALRLQRRSFRVRLEPIHFFIHA